MSGPVVKSDRVTFSKEGETTLLPTSLPVAEKRDVHDLSKFDLPSLSTTGSLPQAAPQPITYHKADAWTKVVVEKIAELGGRGINYLVDVLDEPRLIGRESLRFIPFSDGVKSEGVTIGEMVRLPFAMLGRPIVAFCQGFVGSNPKFDILNGLKRPIALPDMDDPPKKRPDEKK